MYIWFVLKRDCNVQAQLNRSNCALPWSLDNYYRGWFVFISEFLRHICLDLKKYFVIIVVKFIWNIIINQTKPNQWNFGI